MPLSFWESFSFSSVSVGKKRPKFLLSLCGSFYKLKFRPCSAPVGLVLENIFSNLTKTKRIQNNWHDHIWKKLSVTNDELIIKTYRSFPRLILLTGQKRIITIKIILDEKRMVNVIDFSCKNFIKSEISSILQLKKYITPSRRKTKTTLKKGYMKYIR